MIRPEGLLEKALRAFKKIKEDLKKSTEKI